MRPLVAEVFHADGQTDMTKRVVAFRNFANAPKIMMYAKSETKQFGILQASGFCSGERHSY